jgi:immune inhibitor A
MNRKHWLGLAMIVVLLATMLPAMTVFANPPDPESAVTVQPPEDTVVGPPNPMVGVTSQKFMTPAARAAATARKLFDQANPIDRQRINERQSLQAAGLTAAPMGADQTGPDDQVLVILVEFAGTDTFTWNPGDHWDPLGIADPNEYTGTVGDCSKIITTQKTFTYNGPLHNAIPQPLSAADRSGQSIWTEDFSPTWFKGFMFGDGVVFDYYRQDLSHVEADFTGESVKNYFLDMSGGQYEIAGDVVGWLPVNHSSWYYGADRCPGNRSGMTSGAGSDGGIPGAGSPRQLVRDAVDAVNLAYPNFDWTKYDMNGDGVVDRLWIVHAGYGEEDGPVLLNRTDYGEAAVWSHSSAVTPYYPAGDGISVGPYIMMPENGGIGVFAHEYNHNLGGMDLYAYGNGETSAGFWTLAADDWTGYPIGFEPPAEDPMHLDWFGWLNPKTISDPTKEYKFKIGQASNFPGGKDTYRGAKIELPDGQLPLAVPVWQGSYYWWGGKQDLANGMMTTASAIAIPGTGATLSFDLAYGIEEGSTGGWDFLWVQASDDGGATWKTLTNGNTRCDHDPSWIGGMYGFPEDMCAANLGGFTGYNASFPNPDTETFNLAAFANKNVYLRWWYMTDWGTTYEGPFVDNVKVADGANVLFEDDAESGDAKWVYQAPWQRSSGTMAFKHNFYLQWRNVGENGGYDSALGETRWRFGPANTGLLVWYENEFYSDNEIENYLFDHPGFGPKGRMLVIDSHPEPYRYPPLVAAGYDNEGGNLSDRGQMRDAPFTVKDTVTFDYTDPYGWAIVPSIVPDVQPLTYEGRPAVSQFHDSLGYYPGAEYVSRSPYQTKRWATTQWDASTVVPAKEFYGVKAPGYIGSANGSAANEWRFECAINSAGLLGCYYLGTGVGLGYDGGTGNPGDIMAQYGWHVAVVNQAKDGKWGEVRVWNSSAALTSLEKKVNKKTAYAGNTLEYQLKVKNLTPAPQKFSVSDLLPANTTYHKGDFYNAATNSIEWSGTVKANGQETLRFWVKINAGATPGTIVNTATLKDDTQSVTASATTEVKPPPPPKGHRESGQ